MFIIKNYKFKKTIEKHNIKFIKYFNIIGTLKGENNE